MIRPFRFARAPELVFGPGTLRELPRLMRRYGTAALVVTGGRFFTGTPRWTALTAALAREGIAFAHLAVAGEPSPGLVDDACARFRPHPPAVVVAIGGGSALDAGKAFAAMLPQTTRVGDHLEGNPAAIPHDGRTLPFIAVPTTAGTGSEATKNAVLAEVGPAGYKKSLRHDHFVPRVALLDPELTVTCPPELTAACGLDALAQLLEGYLATTASPLTDALARDGLARLIPALVPVCTTAAADLDARGELLYAAYLSGLVLANAGLGAIHGLAGPLGGFFPIPHGVACGTLLAPAIRATVVALRRGDGDHPALGKLAAVGRLFAGDPLLPAAAATDELVRELERWTELLPLPRLGRYGVAAGDLDRIVAAAGLKQHPVALSGDELKSILRQRL